MRYSRTWIPKKGNLRQYNQLQFHMNRLIVWAESDLPKGTRFVIKVKGDMTAVGSTVEMMWFIDPSFQFEKIWADPSGPTLVEDGWRVIKRMTV
jgi:hypothetical protein